MGIREAVLTLVAVLVHELGHILAVILLGGKIKGIRAGAAGIEIVLFNGISSYAADAFLAAAGPAASFFVSMMSAACGGFFNFAGTEFFSGINLLFCLFNLIPVSILDGGKIIYSAATATFGPFFAQKLRIIIDVAVISLLFACGIYVMINCKYNPTLLICAVVIANSCCKSNTRGVKSHNR